MPQIEPSKVTLIGLQVDCPNLGVVLIENAFIYLDNSLDIQIENCLCGETHYLEP